MLIGQRVRDFLDMHHVNYAALPHSPTFPAQKVAAELQVPSKQFAKAVILHADAHLLMAVLPASHRLNLHKLRDSLEARHLEIVPESELADFCPDSELGAFPPFGNLFGMETWVDRSLGKAEDIVFNAGTHQDAVRMKYADYLRLAMPQVANFSELAKPRQAA